MRISKNPSRKVMMAREVAQWVKMRTAKPDKRGLIPWTYMVEWG